VDLGIIPDNFPVIGEVSMQAVGTGYTHSPCLDCNCPKRISPPTLPTTLPFPAIEENVARLKQYLLDYYTSSTFNVCEHQPLPMMERPPMRLMFKPAPTVYHLPIPVPIHWQDDVKAGLDRGVRLGVLEPVPSGEPVAWYHRMVIYAAKKNEKPRRNINNH